MLEHQYQTELTILLFLTMSLTHISSNKSLDFISICHFTIEIITKYEHYDLMFRQNRRIKVEKGKLLFSPSRNNTIC